ncbi:MAG: hypothetical protein RH949_32265 [Coleofasciculus sp. A1-SPW-01]|uniref:hypothetical protein n=1 Tax=Coleofasciculus sp. A1-SPW-01 TaxID=3070819 RepID=UPI00330441AD
MSKPAHPRQSLSSNNSPADKNSNPDSHSLEENTTADESYNFQKTRIIIHLELLPSSEDNQNRLVNIGVGIKNDPPLLATTTLSSLNLPPVIQQMLEELQSQMPERALAASERKMWRQKQEDGQRQRTVKPTPKPCKLPPAQPIHLPDSQSLEAQHQLTLF